jgi:hypothetical protein
VHACTEYYNTTAPFPPLLRRKVLAAPRSVARHQAASYANVRLGVAIHTRARQARPVRLPRSDPRATRAALRRYYSRTHAFDTPAFRARPPCPTPAYKSTNYQGCLAALAVTHELGLHARHVRLLHTRDRHDTPATLRPIAQAYTRTTRLRHTLAMDKFPLPPRLPFHAAPHTNERAWLHRLHPRTCHRLERTYLA